MKTFGWLAAPPVFVEIGQASFRVLDGTHGYEWPLGRQANGRLTPAAKQLLLDNLPKALASQPWSRRRPALCAIHSRGVSLRRFTLPDASKEELQRLIRLRIEAEFPLGPDQLAWGFRELERSGRPGSSTSSMPSTPGCEVIVAAVKREIIDEYAEVLSHCGLTPVFTLAAAARAALCPNQGSACAILEIEHDESELAWFENSMPVVARVVPWGSENLIKGLQHQLQLDRNDAEKLLSSAGRDAAATPDTIGKLRQALSREIETVAGIIHSLSAGQTLYFGGRAAGLVKQLISSSELVKPGAQFGTIDAQLEQDRSSALLGLKELWESRETGAMLILQPGPATRDDSAAGPAGWKWAAAAGLLGLISLFLRYTEPLIQKPRLAQKLAAIRKEQQAVPAIDQELAFLQYFQTNQPSFLEATLALANAAAPSTRIESLGMNRRGDLSLRGILPNAQQAVEFRSKLIQGGFFSSVVLEEQAPAPDRQRIMIRMTAHWKPAGSPPSAGGTAAPSSRITNNSPTPEPPANRVVPTANIQSIPGSNSLGHSPHKGSSH